MSNSTLYLKNGLHCFKICEGKKGKEILNSSTQKCTFIGIIFYFKLSKNHIEKALNESIYSKAILPFSDYDKIYESDEMFEIFKIRLPKIESYSKEEMDTLLEDLEMKEYDDFEYLRKTKGILMTDKFVIEEEK